MIEDLKCGIPKPLSTANFELLIHSLKTCLDHNFLSDIYIFGYGGVMAFHYKTIIDT